MRFITIAILGVFWLFSANAVLADDSGLCRASDGRYLTGRVIQGPNFVMGHSRDGVELSHSHIILQADKDGQLYDVAIDNIFASGYDSAGETVPAPLSSIAVGDRLELCGALYRHGGLGIHWLHTDCGKPPTFRRPDGWIKILASDGKPGPNLEDSREYCGLWR